MFNKKSKALWAAIGLLTVGLVPQAFAAGTAAGALVENTASVSYQVDGVDQEDVSSNTTSFTVDRIVNMTLVEDGSSYVSTVPGAQNQVTSYTLTNLSNAEIQFDLEALNSAGIVFEDEKDGTNVRVFLDDGTGFDPTDTPVTFVNLPADTDFSAASPQVTLYVAMDVPLDNGGTPIVNGDRIEVELTATAKEADGSTLSLGPDAAGVETVLGDDLNPVNGNVQFDGAVVAYGAYEVETAALTVAKYSSIVSDPFNDTTDPKFIPGAVVEYCIVVSNSGSNDASTVTVTDNIPTDTTYDPASGVASGSVVGVPATDATACQTDEGAVDTLSNSAASISATFNTLAGGSYVWISFQVTLN